MKNCLYCGRDNLDDALNCRECGTEFEQVREPIPPQKVEPVKSFSLNRESDTQAATKPSLKYDNILASTRGMAETHAKKVVIFVPADEVIRVTLKYGRSDHRPIISLSIGIVLSLVGIFGLIEMVEAPGGFRYELAMAAFGVVGVSMIFDTLKQRFFFEVQKKQDVSRLILSKNAQKKDVQNFCQQLRSIYKYDITDAV